MLTLQECSIITLTICTIITSFVAIRSFNRNQKFENENTIFKLKLDGYFLLIDKILELLDLIGATDDTIERNINEPEIVFELAEEVSDKTLKVLNTALRYYTIFPEKIIDELDVLQDLLIPIQENFDEGERIENLLEVSGRKYKPILDHLDNLQLLMREDIGASKLNKTLSKRLR